MSQSFHQPESCSWPRGDKTWKRSLLILVLDQKWANLSFIALWPVLSCVSVLWNVPNLNHTLFFHDTLECLIGVNNFRERLYTPNKQTNEQTNTQTCIIASRPRTPSLFSLTRTACFMNSSESGLRVSLQSFSLSSIDLSMDAIICCWKSVVILSRYSACALLIGSIPVAKTPKWTKCQSRRVYHVK